MSPQLLLQQVITEESEVHTKLQSSFAIRGVSSAALLSYIRLGVIPKSARSGYMKDAVHVFPNVEKFPDFSFDKSYQSLIEDAKGYAHEQEYFDAMLGRLDEFGIDSALLSNEQKYIIRDTVSYQNISQEDIPYIDEDFEDVNEQSGGEYTVGQVLHKFHCTEKDAAKGVLIGFNNELLEYYPQPGDDRNDLVIRIPKLDGLPLSTTTFIYPLSTEMKSRVVKILERV